MPTVRFVVKGRVQGVGFRAYVQQTADAHGLSGEVWNRSDGGVEAIVTSDDPDTLDRFAKDLHDGPGRVVSVEQSTAPDKKFDHFSVSWTR